MSGTPAAQPKTPSPAELLAAIADIGVDRVRGGFSRHVFDRAESDLREWFTAEAARRGLAVDTDHNGNLWAWWGEPGSNALITGSHLDSVPGGGAFDGALGVASAFCAVDALRAKGFQPNRPFAVVMFAEEEGSRFGVPCLGSQLLTGAYPADAALRLRDRQGVTLDEAMRGAGLDPSRVGEDTEALGRIGCFVELHVEQGRGLIDMNAPLAVASSLFAHGRWRFTFRGQGNHAGATLIGDRHDPMLPASELVMAARKAAAGRDNARATIGRMQPNPGGTNVIPSSVDVWLDARAETDSVTTAMVDEIIASARRAAAAEGCVVEISRETFNGPIGFDVSLRDRVRDAVSAELGTVPLLPCGAGHDAGILAEKLPTAMLFVRNPTGVSHAPEEFAESDDCATGGRALTLVLENLAT